MRGRGAIGESAAPGARDEDFVPKFRALKVGGSRRGIRLEQIYWTILNEIAAQKGMGLGQYVESVAARFPEAVNITSVLRVNATGWLHDRYEEARRHTGLAVVDALVQACPSPAFALQEGKRIVAYNQAFIGYIQARFSRFSSTSMAKELRLSLDVQIGELAEMLKKADGKPVRTGFVLGIEDQRLRGQLSTTLAPSPDKMTILGYVAQM